MERGEDWEYEAVRARWTAIERRRRVTRRLVAAFFAGLVAVVLLLLAVPQEACMYGPGLPNTCNPATAGAVEGGLVIAALGALAVGLWLCRSAMVVHTRYGRNGC